MKQLLKLFWAIIRLLTPGPEMPPEPINEEKEAVPKTTLPEIVEPVDPLPKTRASTEHFEQHDFLRFGTKLPDELVSGLQGLIDQLEIIRRAFGDNKVIITDGYRTPEQNANTRGSAPNSLHMKALAADFVIKNVHPSIVFDGCRALISTGDLSDGGLGGYDDHVHYDLGEPRMWDERTKT